MKVNFALDKTMFIQSRAAPLVLDQDHHHDIEHELAASYYTREELQSFRDEADAIAGLYRQQQRHHQQRQSHGKSTRNNVVLCCIRGLEHRIANSSSGSGTRMRVPTSSSNKSKRSRAIEAVLREQSRQQQKMQETDEETLAEVYKGFCITSASQAQRIAQVDEKVANMFYTQQSVEDDELLGGSKPAVAKIQEQLLRCAAVAQSTRLRR